MSSRPLEVGVVGVGSMGVNHARVYQELPCARLAGVSDVDADQASSVAAEYETAALPREDLLAAVDAVSIAVPTRHHYDIALEAIDAGVHVLVEKPFVDDPAKGRRLIERAAESDVTLQVGHIERFNPAVEVLSEVVADLDLIAVEARRLGPPVGRNAGDGVVLDLMVHDLDVLLSLVDSEVRHVDAAGTRGNQYVAANVAFEDGTVGTLSASRLTQEKVRKLSVTTEDSQVNLDYIDQSLSVHRDAVPAYVRNGKGVRYRTESVVERPVVESAEPLKRELAAFVDAVKSGTEPLVTGEDALTVLDLARTIDELASKNGVEPLVRSL